MYHIPSGGYIQGSADQVIRLPISRTILPGEKSDNMTLCVPFKGKAKLTSDNYSTYGDSIFSHRPLFVNIVKLEVSSKTLVVTVSSEDGRQTMIFFDINQ